jgi:TetR/AcrR family transcriptional regulator
MALEVSRDSERSRAAILEAAERLFATDGYDRTSLAAIGEAARVSRGLPSYFFSSKQELYDAVLARSARIIDELLESMKHALRERGLEPALEHYIDLYIDFLAANPNVVRLLQWQFLLGDPSGNAPVTVAFREMVDILTTRVPTGRSIEARLFTLSVVGMAIFPFMTAPRDARFAKAYKQHLIKLLREGARA